MPKTANGLWEEFVSWDNLLLAAKEASKGRRCKQSILYFNSRLEEHLLDIQEQLLAGTWRPGHYRMFKVYEPKERTVHAPSFADRVVHHALAQVIGPHFERIFIDKSFACRVGKGTHAASTCLYKQMASAHEKWGGKVYALKADIAKYFNSIDHEILLKILRRTIQDKRILQVLRAQIEQCPCIEGNVGLPLGALTSQLFANAYLNKFDHYIKDELGLRYYVRYMDDFVILHNDKRYLQELLVHLKMYLAKELKLGVNGKTSIFPVSQGVDFAGFRHKSGCILPRRRNVARAKRRFKAVSKKFALGIVDIPEARSCAASFVGYIQHCKGWKTGSSALENLVLIRSSGEEEE